MKGRHEIFSTEPSSRQAAALALPVPVPLVSERFCKYYDDLLERNFKRHNPIFLQQVAHLLEEFELDYNSSSTSEQRTQSVFKFFSILAQRPLIRTCIQDQQLIDIMRPEAPAAGQLFAFKKLMAPKGYDLFLAALTASYFKVALFFLDEEIHPFSVLSQKQQFKAYLWEKETAFGHLNHLGRLLLLSDFLFRKILTLSADEQQFKAIRHELKSLRKRFRDTLLLEEEPKETQALRALMSKEVFQTAFSYYMMGTTSRHADFKAQCTRHISKTILPELNQFFSKDPAVFVKESRQSLEQSEINRIRQMIEDANSGNTLDSFVRIARLMIADTSDYYSGKYFSAFFSYLKSLIERDDFVAINRMIDKLEKLDEVVEVPRESRELYPELFVELFPELLIRSCPDSGHTLLEMLFDRYRWILSNPSPRLNQSIYTSFLSMILEIIFPNMHQVNLVDYILYETDSVQSKKSGSKESLRNKFIYFWQMSLSVMNDPGSILIYSKQAPDKLKKKIKENLIRIADDSEAVSLFASSFHGLYLLVQIVSLDSQLEKIRADLHLILEVLREGDEQFKVYHTELLRDDLGFEESSIQEIELKLSKELWAADQAALLEGFAKAPTSEKEQRRVLQAPSCRLELRRPSELPLPEDQGLVAQVPPLLELSHAPLQALPITEVPLILDPLKQNKTLLKESLLEIQGHIQRFKLALTDLARLDSSGNIPFAIISALLEHREQLVIKLGRYIKRWGPKKVILIDFHALEDETIILPESLSPSLLAIEQGVQSLKRLLQGVTTVLAVADYPFMSDIDVLKKIVGSINIPVTTVLDFGASLACSSAADAEDELRLAQPAAADSIQETAVSLPVCLSASEIGEGITQTESATRSTQRDSTGRTSSLSGDSVSLGLASSLLTILAGAQRSFEEMIGALTPLLIQTLSLSDHQVPLAWSIPLSQEVEDLWQLMQQVNQWVERFGTEPMGDDLFKKGPRRECPKERLHSLLSLEPLLHRTFLNHIARWNSAINQLAFKLKDDESCTLNPNTAKFLDTLSACYFYPRNKPDYVYLQRIFGHLGTVEAFGLELFFLDACDRDARIILTDHDISAEALLRRIESEQGLPLRSLKGKVTQLNDGDRAYQVLNFQLPGISSEQLPLDITVYMNGFLKTESYIAHAAASLNLNDGCMRISHEFFKAILAGELMIRDNDSEIRRGNIVSKEMHILKFLIRVQCVTPVYCGRLTPLRYLPEAISRLEILSKYRNNVASLAKDHPLLNAALQKLLQCHFNKHQATDAYQQRSLNLLHFFERLGIHLIVNVGDKQFSMQSNPMIQRSLQFTLIEKGIKIDPCCSLMLELPSIEPFLPPVSVALLGLFGGGGVAGGSGPSVSNFYYGR